MLTYTPKHLRTNWVYIMTNRRNGTLYTGSTSDIIARVSEHKARQISGFTQKYNLTQLVWFEMAADLDTALIREGRIKRWQRQWKIDLIENLNPHWQDLHEAAKRHMMCVSDY